VKAVIDVNDVNELDALTRLRGLGRSPRPADLVRAPAPAGRPGGSAGGSRVRLSQAPRGSSYPPHRPTPSSRRWPWLPSLVAPLTFPPTRGRLRSFMSYVVSASVHRRTIARRSHVNYVKPRQSQGLTTRTSHKRPLRYSATVLQCRIRGELAQSRTSRNRRRDYSFATDVQQTLRSHAGRCSSRASMSSWSVVSGSPGGDGGLVGEHDGLD
jgi:hypothetical protein